MVDVAPDGALVHVQPGGQVSGGAGAAGVTFAHLPDPAGNHFAVFKPPFAQP